jgi:hypothetical protein
MNQVRFLLIGFVAISALVSRGAQASPVNPVKRNATIDFANLPGVENMVDYTLRLSLVAEGDVTTSEKYNIGAGSSPEAVRALVQASLDGIWKVRAVETTTIEIEGYLGKGKLHRVQKVEAACPSLPKTNQPIVKQASNRALDK